MEENKKVYHRKLKRLLLIARIWSGIVIAIGLMIFGSYAYNYFKTGVADPYAIDDYPFIENIPPFLMLISVFGLILAWKWKLLGGSIVIVSCIVNYIIFLIHWPLTENIRYLFAPYGTNLIILIPAIMFVVYWRKLRKIA